MRNPTSGINPQRDKADCGNHAQGTNDEHDVALGVRVVELGGQTW